jgi:hypothetical protein
MQVVDVNGNMFGYDHLEIIGADGRPKTLDSGLTSVGLSMPSAFTVSNSPLTSNGTIGVTGAGTTSQYIDGTGALRAFPGLTGFVPYVGATQDVNLGEFGLTAGQLTLDVSPTGTAVVGTTRWNNTIGSSETTLKGGSVILKNGVDLVARVVNKVTPNTTLTKAGYAAVRVSGAQGQRLAVAYAQANNDNNSADTIGLVAETIATNQEGFIITVGQLEEINTTGSLQGETWADGDVLYLSPTIPGALTNIKPNGSTGHIVVMGYVEYAHANHGKIYVKIMNGWELDELHNVYINNPLNNQGLFYETSTQLWKNKSIDTALGYTPVPTTRQLTINGTTYDLSANRTWSVGTVTAVTASSPLSSSGGTTPNITISQASGTDNGYLSSTDWTTFNNKQPAGNYITALSGEATGSGPGTASVTLNNASVTAKVLTGVNVTGGSINASDSILTAFGKLQNQINGLIGSSIYQGVWNASTNTPALTSGVGTRGYYYIVNVAGSTNLDGITDWNVGDWAIFDGTAWQQVDNTDSVTSVNGQTGAVSLTTDNIPEGVTNLYFTNLRARQALTLTTLGTSGAATYSNTTGILNIPQYQSVLTNPVTGTGTANYVARWTSSSEIGTGVLYDNGTNVGIGTASPVGKLSVDGGDFRFNYGNAAANHYFYLNLKSGQDGGVLLTRDNSTLDWQITNSTSGNLWFYAYGLGSVALTMQRSNGFVGIGTTSPSKTLDVFGNVRFQNAVSRLDFTTGYAGSGDLPAGVLLSTWDTSSNNLAIIPSAQGTDGSKVVFGAYNGSVWRSMVEFANTSGEPNLLLAKSAGNVGIGTTTPANKLSISSGTFNNGATVASILNTSSTQKAHVGYDTLLIQQDDAPTLRLYETLENLSTTISSDAGLTSFATTGEMGLFVAGSNTAPGYSGLNGIQAIRINISGNIGIGTTSIPGNTTNKVLAIEGSDSANLLVTETGGASAAFTSYGNEAYIGTSTNHPFYMYTNDVERMRITSAGNVGIGTTDPNGALSFADDIRTRKIVLWDGSANNNYQFYGFGVESGTMIQSIYDSSDRFLWVSGASSTTRNELMVIQGNGRVGIGTSSPLFTLEVNGPGRFNGSLSIQGNSTPPTTGYGLEITNTSTTSYLGAYNRDTSSYRNLFLFSNDTIFENGGFERMRITAVGTVGIGTGSPSSLLHIYGSGSTFTRYTNTSSSGHFMDVGANNSGESFVYGYGSYPLLFATDGNERMRIASNGDIRVGHTDNYGSRFSVKQPSSGSAANFSNGVDADLNVEITAVGAATKYAKLSPSVPVPLVLSIISGSNVGIGTTTPSEKLHVSGNLRVTGTIIDSNNSAGTSGQVLSSTGSGTDWVSLSEISGVDGTGTANYVAKWSDTDTITNSQLFDNGTNVGIGTNSPNASYKLTISGSTYQVGTNSKIYVDNGGIGGASAILGVVGTSYGYLNTDGAYPFVFQTNSTERMRITSGGNVGIGTTSPATKFDVQLATNKHILFHNGNGEAEILGTTDNGSYYAPLFISATPLVLNVNNNSNVGIGTSSPSYKLHVEGTIYSPVYTSGNITINAGDFLFSADGGGDGFQMDYYNGQMYLGNNAGTSWHMVMQDNGNVGIGTTSPSEMLEVNGNVQIGSSVDAKLYMVSSGGNGYNERFFIEGYADGGTYGGGFKLSTRNDSNIFNTAVTVNRNGLVGIGTTSPSTLLDVRGEVSVAYNATYGLRFYNDARNNWSFIGNSVSGSSSANLRFGDATGEVMRITGGNVGIGTTNPGYRLEVNGGSDTFVASFINSSASQSFIRVGDTSDANYSGLALYSDSGSGQMFKNGTGSNSWGGNASLNIYNSNGSIAFHPNNTANAMFIATSGNVGIATTAPSEKLHVSGNLRVTGAIYDSNNQAGTSGQVLSSTGSGTDWVDSPTSTATSVAQLLPSATVNYSWVGQVIDGTWVDIFTRANNVLTTGVWTVTMYVSDFGQGGNHYTYRYSGTMTWYQDGTNQTGLPAASEIALHRMGHAANNCILYLRTTEEAASDGGNGKLQINANYSNTSNTTITFTFVKII